MTRTFLLTLMSRLSFLSGMGPPRGIRLDRRSPLWTMAGGIVVSTILFWVMVQLGQASPEPKNSAPSAAALTKTGLALGAEGIGQGAENQAVGSVAKPTGAQGPAVDVPRAGEATFHAASPESTITVG